jgi:hypothetical protein
MRLWLRTKKTEKKIIFVSAINLQINQLIDVILNGYESKIEID